MTFKRANSMDFVLNRNFFRLQKTLTVVDNLFSQKKKTNSVASKPIVGINASEISNLVLFRKLIQMENDK